MILNVFSCIFPPGPKDTKRYVVSKCPGSGRYIKIQKDTCRGSTATHCLFLQQNIAAATQSVSETKVRQLGETTVRQFAKIQSIAPVKQNDPRCDTKTSKTCIRGNPQNLHLRAEIKGSFIFSNSENYVSYLSQKYLSEKSKKVKT